MITGEGRIRGRRVAIIVSEFNFLAGSIGREAAERITTAIERATAESLPLLAGPTSGGTRCRKELPLSWQWSKLRRPCATTARRACHTWSTCAIPRPAE